MADLPRPHRLNPGDIAPVHSFRTIHGAVVDIIAQALPTHIQFRRFAGCPVCNLHLRSLIQRKTEVDAAVREVVLFHSSVEELLIHAADLPFDVVADPDKTIYRAFAVESDRRALLDRRAWPTIARSGVRTLPDAMTGHRPVPPLNPAGGRHGLPADFLITPDGCIEACKYGDHADDQWTVDDVLALVAWISPRSARA
jgi:peroxiredoxin